MIVKHILHLFAAAGRVNSKKYKVVSSEHDALPEQHTWPHQCFQEKRL